MPGSLEKDRDKTLVILKLPQELHIREQFANCIVLRAVR
jgi:hypothetical protein